MLHHVNHFFQTLFIKELPALWHYYLRLARHRLSVCPFRLLVVLPANGPDFSSACKNLQQSASRFEQLFIYLTIPIRKEDIALCMICIQNISSRCVEGNGSSSPSSLSKSAWWSCLFHCQKKDERGLSIIANPVLPSKYNPGACSCCTYMTCTTTPMPDTASRSTAFSIAWEMVSNKSSGSCWQTVVFTHFTAELTDVTVDANCIYFSQVIKVHIVSHHLGA